MSTDPRVGAEAVAYSNFGYVSVINIAYVLRRTEKRNAFSTKSNMPRGCFPESTIANHDTTTTKQAPIETKTAINAAGSPRGDATRW